MSKKSDSIEFSPIWQLSQLVPQPRLRDDCSTIVQYFERLSLIVEEDQQPAAAPTESCPLRTDTIHEDPHTAAGIRAGAPALHDNFFLVPPVMQSTDEQ